MSGGQTWGFDSIGAVATKKPGGSVALQETFPTVFADTFAMMGSPQSYLPSGGEAHAPLPEGNSFQSSYHAEKKRDADRMAKAKVHSTRMMNTRAFSSHNGYYGMPQPVLGQRVFANETGGIFSLNSARQNYADAPFHYSDAHGAHGGALSGGVLRTAEGQGYAKARLVARVAQLNAIDANAGNFTPDPRDKISAPTGITESITAIQDKGDTGNQAKTELFLLLQNINDSLMGEEIAAGEDQYGDITAFTYKDTTRALGLLFRLTPTLEDYELTDVQDLVRDIIIKLNSIVANEGSVSAPNYEVAVSLATLFDKAHDYLSEFARQTTEFGTRTDAEKLQISKSLVRSLGFARSMSEARTQTQSEIVSGAEETRRIMEEDNEPMSGEFGSTSGTNGSGRAGMALDPQLRYAKQDFLSSARFSELAPTRESTRATQIQHQSGLGTFDVDERGAFGNNAGHFYPTGGRDVGFVDEGIDGPPEQPVNQRYGPGPDIARISTRPGAPTVRETVPDVRGRFDDDTQAFNVETRGKGKAGMELPKTREGFVELAHKINEMPESQRPTKDGKKIQVYASSTLASLRKNFKRRLNID
jgi:hypothetical protein